MKSSPLKLGVILSIIGFAIFGCAEGWGAEWKLLAENENRQFYLDTKSITLLPKNIVRVWAESVFTDRGIINAMKKLGTEYGDLHNERTLFELNCGEKTYRNLSVTLFSKDGEVLGSSESGDLTIERMNEWDFIIPGTFADLIYQEVCTLEQYFNIFNSVIRHRTDEFEN